MSLIKNKKPKVPIAITTLASGFVVSICLLAGTQLVSAVGARCNNVFLNPQNDPTKVVYCKLPTAIPISTGSFLADHCYQVSLRSNGTYWWQAQPDCNGVPFKTTTGTTSGSATLPDQPGLTECSLRPGDAPAGCRVYGRWLFPFIDTLAVGVGVTVTIMIVIGGIQYSAARGDPNAVAAARRKVSNAVLALVAFGFFWSFMQWLVPGGIF